MKYQHIMLAFLIATPFNALLRLIQMLFTTNELGQALENGESMNYNLISYVLWIFIFLIVIGCGVIGALTRRCPKNTPKMNYWLMAASIAIGVACVFHALYAVSTFAWLTGLIRAFGILSGILFLVYATKGFKDFDIPPLCFAVPIMLFILRLVNRFVTQNAMPLTIQRVMALLVDCALLLFFLEMGKQFNGIDKNLNYRKLLTVGLVCCNLSFVYAVPNLITAIVSPTRVNGIDISDNLFVLFSALFAAAFIFSHFSENNLGVIHHHRHHRRRSDPGRNADQLYTGD